MGGVLKDNFALSTRSRGKSECAVGGNRNIGAINAGILSKRQNPRAFISRLHAISLPIWGSLMGFTGTGILLGQFSRAVNVLIDDHVIALVVPSVGEGPFHGVIDVLPDYSLPRNLVVKWDLAQLWLGMWRIRIADAPIFWNPRVCWEQLRFEPDATRCLRALVVAEGQRRGVFRDGHVVPGANGVGRAEMPIAALEMAWESGNTDAFLSQVARLAGRGPGLTPSGDDFLAGLMLALWARGGEAARSLCRSMVAVAAPRTTRLSRAFLEAAAEGLADTHWHALFHALDINDEVAIEHAAQAVFAFGATSGFDMLAGFLWGDLSELTVNLHS